MADVKGDMRIGAKTVPLVYGIKNAKRITGVLIVATIIGLVVLQQLVVDDIYSLLYLLVAVVVPLAASLLFNHFAVRRPDFVKAGNALKVAMLGGLIYSIVHYYIYYTAAFD